MTGQSKEIFSNLNLNVSIEKVMHDDWNFIFFLKIFNRSLNKRKVKLRKTIYLTKGKEQLDQDDWKSGYFKEEDLLFGNAFKIAGLEFSKEKLKSVNDGDIIYTTIELPQEGNSISISFKKNGKDWDLIEIEQSEIEIKLSVEQLNKYLLSKIERLESYEEITGVTLEKISVQTKESSDYFYIYIELHPVLGTQIKNDIDVHCVLYDNNGSVTYKTHSNIQKTDFFGFEVVSFCLNPKITEISKIRIFPKFR